jgi:hypothetical protein
MNKNFVVILLIFNLFACNPAQQVSQNKTAPSQIPFACLASQSRCDVNTDLGTFTVQFSGQIEQGKVKTELPFQIKLLFDAKVESAKLINVSSYLEGKSMFMGKIPVFFQGIEKNNNVTIAETLLVNCSEEIMTWRLWFSIEIEQMGKAVQQDFFIDFDSKRL